MDEQDEFPQTGDERVDEALRRVADLDGVDVAEHPALFEQAHEVLRELLRSSQARS